MAVAFAAGGAPSQGTTDLTPDTPDPVVAGNKLFCIVQNKYPLNGPATPSGYQLGAQAAGGSGSSGADAGSAYTTIFERTAQGNEGGVTVPVSIPSANVSVAKIVYFTKSPGYAWDIEYKTGAESTPAGTWSITFAATSLRKGDIVMVVSTVNGNTYEFSGSHLAASGITFANEIDLASNAIPTGDDLAWMVSLHEVTAGEATVAPTFTMTSSGSGANEPAGSAVLVRLREVGGGGVMARGAPARRVLRRSSRWSMVSEDRPSDLDLP